MDVTPPPPLVVVEPVEVPSAATHHKSFMSAKPPQFVGQEGPNKAEEWPKEIEIALYIVEILVRLWADLIDICWSAIKAWWKTLLKVKYGREEPA